MSGHVFVVGADLTRLSCDDVLVPTDRSLRVTRSWRSLLPIFNTASLVGFGSVIASLSAFALIRDSVIGIGGDNPLISLAISVNLLAGMTGSASGGMSIALTTLGTSAGWRSAPMRSAPSIWRRPRPQASRPT